MPTWDQQVDNVSCSLPQGYRQEKDHQLVELGTGLTGKQALGSMPDQVSNA